jgi:hypothetical protein
MWNMHGVRRLFLVARTTVIFGVNNRVNETLDITSWKSRVRLIILINRSCSSWHMVEINIFSTGRKCRYEPLSIVFTSSLDNKTLFLVKWLISSVMSFIQRLSSWLDIKDPYIQNHFSVYHIQYLSRISSVLFVLFSAIFRFSHYFLVKYVVLWHLLAH